ncbi:hypothetical protein RRG08_043060 [Elysia crispata]|uniref:Uncharacterized protein n=1 Tax=Elysia crispata TaxID=231223 RepID=A0AAE0XYI8_9GAST|nr:hypothetical protein RRG08_043060 [Elysia crispata]
MRIRAGRYTVKINAKGFIQQLAKPTEKFASRKCSNVDGVAQIYGHSNHGDVDADDKDKTWRRVLEQSPHEPHTVWDSSLCEQ